MAAGSWQIYSSFIEKMGNKLIDLDADTFKMILLANTYTPAINTHDDYADVSGNELSGNGYAAVSLTVTWDRAGGATNTFDSSVNPVFTAAGGSIVAKYAVIYDDTNATDALVAYCDLETGGGDVTVTNGNTLTVTIHANGIFTAAAA